MADEGKKYVLHGMYAECSMGTMKNYLNTDVGHGIVYQGQPLLNANDHTPQINLTHFGDCKSRLIFEEAKKQADEKYKSEVGDNFFQRAGKAIARRATKASLTLQEYLGTNKCQLDTPLPWRFCNDEHMIDGAPALTIDSVCPCRYGGIIKIVDTPESEAETEKTVSVSMEPALAEAEVQTETLKADQDSQGKEDDSSLKNIKNLDTQEMFKCFGQLMLSVMPVHCEPLVYPKTLTEEQQYENAKYIYHYLKINGWSDEAACGAIGNFAHEGVLNPGEWQSSNKTKNGYGLAQWSQAEDTILVKLAQIQGKKGFLPEQDADKMAAENPRELMNIELEYLLETANTKGIWGPFGKHYKPFKMEYNDYKTASIKDNKDYTVENLAYVFCAHYERPAATAKKDLEERAESAEKWYTLFCGNNEN